MYNNREYEYLNITNTNSPYVQIFSGKGILHSVIVNKNSPGVFILTDNGSPVATIDTNAQIGDLVYDVKIANGLRLGNVGSPDVTITYTQ